MISKHYETLFWRAEKRRNYVDAYQPVLLFKSSCWKKQIRKLVYSTKEWRFQAHDTSVGNKKLFMEKTLLIFTFAVCVGKKHTQWKQIGYKLLERNLCTRQRKMNYDTKDFHLTITPLTILLQERRRPTLLCQIKAPSILSLSTTVHSVEKWLKKVSLDWKFCTYSFGTSELRNFGKLEIRQIM